MKNGVLLISEQYLPGVGPFFQIAATRVKKNMFDSWNQFELVMKVIETTVCNGNLVRANNDGKR